MTRIIKAVWFSLCVLVLCFWFVKRGEREMDIIAIYGMMVLAFPSGWVAAMAIEIVFYAFERLGYPVPGAAQMALFWIACVSIGYWQWFVALPYLFRQLRKHCP